MGFNTTVLILNDAWGAIRENAQEFVDKLSPYINGGIQEQDRNPWQRERRDDEVGESGVDISVGYHANAAQVIENQHANDVQVILAGGNYATILGTAWSTDHRGGHHTKQQVKDALNQVLKEYDLRVVEAPKRKR